MRLLLTFLIFVLACASFAQNSAEKDTRMQWWREARLGLFIHWGVYSVPAGKYGDKTNYAEWIREEAHIPVHEYENYRSEFNPVDFDAEKWVRMAKDAGMKYIVITTKHHDGFDLFATKYGDWNIMHTPFKRDIMKELSAACDRNGIKMCWYHSIMDWHEPDYLPRRSWETKDRPATGADFQKYVEYLRNQVTELLTNYGPIGVMWFDGQWESTWSDKYGKPLYELCRSLQPNVIVNNRVSNSNIGDFSTPEQYIPPTGLPGVDWETCMTMNNHWGYNKYDTNWKSPKSLIRNIVDIASKGGNYLLNIGPMSNGEFPPEAVERLKAIGDFMHVNGDAIYGTGASVFDELPWGRSTTRHGANSTTLFLHVFDWPADGRLVVPAIGNKPESATLLATGENLKMERSGSDIVISLPAKAPSEISSTVALAIDGDPKVYHTPKIEAPADILVSRTKVTIDPGSKGVEVRYTTDGSDPTPTSTLYSEPFPVDATTTVRAAVFAEGAKVSAIAERTFSKVAPSPAHSPAGALRPGLACREYAGEWEKMPDFSKLTPRRSFHAKELGYPMKNGAPEEHVGRVFEGYLTVSADEVYVFSLNSDDGSRLYIDGNLVVDNDGLHSPSAKEGNAALAAGLHTIRVEWFNNAGGAELGLAWGRAGEKPSPLAPREISTLMPGR